jgi:hypothetical protein
MIERAGSSSWAKLCTHDNGATACDRAAQFDATQREVAGAAQHFSASVIAPMLASLARMGARRRRPRPQEPETVGELLHASYANLAMAHAAVMRDLAEYDVGAYMIRARLLRGLRTGAMHVGSLFADVRQMPVDRCAYCAIAPPLALHADHLIPRHRGGPESGDNLVWACRTCNTQRSARDLLEWYASQGRFAPLALLRRYLKLALLEAHHRDLMEAPLADKPSVTFSLEHVRARFRHRGNFGGSGDFTAGASSGRRLSETETLRSYRKSPDPYPRRVWDSPPCAVPMGRGSSGIAVAKDERMPSKFSWLDHSDRDRRRMLG